MQENCTELKLQWSSDTFWGSLACLRFGVACPNRAGKLIFVLGLMDVQIGQGSSDEWCYTVSWPSFCCEVNSSGSSALLFSIDDSDVGWCSGAKLTGPLTPVFVGPAEGNADEPETKPKFVSVVQLNFNVIAHKHAHSEFTAHAQRYHMLIGYRLCLV